MPSLPPSLSLVLLVSGATGVVGLWVVVAGVGVTPKNSRGDIVVRIAHRLRDVSDEARTVLHPHSCDPIVIAGVVIGPSWQRASAWFHQIAGGSHDASLRLARGYGENDYLVRRFLSALGGIAAGLAVGAAAWLSRPGVPGGLVGAAGLIGGVAGVGLFDRHLRQAVERRQERLSEEFPTVLELLSLALAAGDSLPGALRRVATRGSGDLALEWARVLRLVDAGQPLAATLRQSSRELGVAEIEALTEHLASALERGVALAQVVRAHSSDSRLHRLRSIVERAGKAEVWMLIPLVLIILPITVIFAVWPSLNALQFSF